MNSLGIKLGFLALVSVGCITGGQYAMQYFRPIPEQTAATILVPASVRTVGWFKAHRVEMQTKNVACNDDPGMGMLDPECENAAQAKLGSGLDDAIKRYDGATK
jgi:hypothetical protein